MSNISTTPNRGYDLIATGQGGSPDATTNLAIAHNQVATALDLLAGITNLEGTSPALAIPFGAGAPNVAALGHAGGSAAYTLAAPVAGLPSAGGNDGLSLRLVNRSTTNSITVAAAPNVFQGAHSLLTVTAGGGVDLIAVDGFWMVIGSQGLTISA